MTHLDKFAAVVLAAGASRRMGGEAKLLRQFRGRPLLAHCLDVVSSLGLSQAVVVVRPDVDAMAAFLNHWPVDRVSNDKPEQGIGSSIAAGVSHIKEEVSGAFIVLGDMPFIDEETYRGVARYFDPAGLKTIGAPCYLGRMGHPVLFGREHFAELKKLHGDVGGRFLIDKNRHKVFQVPIATENEFIDLDRADDFRRWNGTVHAVNDGWHSPTD